MRKSLADDTSLELTPVRLKGGRKAYLFIPMEFYLEDVEAITEWLKLYITPRLLADKTDANHD